MPAPDLGSIAVATGFLTRLPVGRRTVTADAMLRAAPLFPLVGAAIGALVGATALGLAELLPASIAGALAVGLELVLTGALHLDGLADSADGLAGRRPGDALAVMRDHALGTYGGAALALDLLLKAAALGALADAGSLVPVVAALALSRAAPLPLAAALPYARPGEGTGRLLSERLRPGPAVAGVAVAVAVALAAVQLDALALFFAAAAVVALVGVLARRRLEGVTGDVMGAATELSATVALVAAAGLWT
ncbi:MAG TPA: adenosylcobinamide-GDP ribazoletransferase [Solirubrobacterales bacterium]|nr:adenosylcobinamide-GDP ribazoletransferase [Solirubrobacterales bacterium]